MSIRRKLFYAFIGVVAVPLAIAAALARHYLAWERAALDQRFVERATEAFHAMEAATGARLDQLRRDVHQVAQDHDLCDGSVDIKVIIDGKNVNVTGPARTEARVVHVPSFQVQSGMPPLLQDLRRRHPEILGVQLASDDNVIYTDYKDEVKLPSGIWGSDRAPDGGGIFIAAGGRQFLREAIDDGDGTVLLVELDPQAVVQPARVLKSGWTLYLKPDDRRPWHLPFVVWHEGAAGAQLNKSLDAALASFGYDLPKGGEMASASDGNWVGWRLYAALASESDAHHLAGDARLVAIAPEAEIYAPLVWFRVEVYGALLASLLIAAWLSYFLSGRLVGAVDRIRHGVEALSRGEWAQLDKLSEDELGGGLVESVNQMASALAERTRREEIEGWRRLVRVLSHEINNTLAPVRSVAVTVRDQIAGRVGAEDAAEDLRLAFQLIVDRTDALTAFIAGYAELAKLPDPARVETDFNAVVEGAARLFREDAEKANVTFAVELDAEAGRARVDAGQLERVVINLVKNAVEAVASGGAVTVKTARHGGSVELTVDDDGPGIALEARRHLFVPYFTTKPGGSGIGLALVRQIVLGHGGTVTAEDRPGGGTRVRVLLPLK
ncbi:MAG TPA: HAMP domain-containing sensor histidine kinase [Polyangia bacterium]|nr:HAMP domain-containing sensor histidine kinase [Polyangia bacterium]